VAKMKLSLGKTNIQLLAIVLVGVFLVGMVTFSFFQKDLPMIFPRQMKAKYFNIETTDIFEDPGDPDVSYSCAVARSEAFGYDIVFVDYPIICEGHRTTTGARCLCVISNE
jgi:hypothetical protein